MTLLVPPGDPGRAFAGPAALALLVALAGCGGGSDTATSSSSASATTGGATASAVPTTSESSGSTSGGSQATPAIVSAAKPFLGTLTADEKSKVLFARDDTTQKQKWSNLPTGLFQRSGLAVGDLTEAKVNAFLALMKATLSTEGYNRVVEEWSADDALAASSSGGGGVRS